ncbi:hypothetical protein, partial [Xanthomonas campestris]|uniref:hypothetical protein n=1 Tax=Xanthomonas campestris TaxID=339 RepID=UPI001E645A53
HARTFFQAIMSQVIDLTGGNVGKPQVLAAFQVLIVVTLQLSPANVADQAKQPPQIPAVEQRLRVVGDRHVALVRKPPTVPMHESGLPEIGSQGSKE